MVRHTTHCCASPLFDLSRRRKDVDTKSPFDVIGGGQMRGLLKLMWRCSLCLNRGRLPIQGLVRLSGVVSFAPTG